MQSYSNPGEPSVSVLHTNSTTGVAAYCKRSMENEISEESKISADLVSDSRLCSCSGLSHVQSHSRTISHPLQAAGKYHCTGWGRKASHYGEKVSWKEIVGGSDEFKEMVNTNLELSEHLMAVKLNERSRRFCFSPRSIPIFFIIHWIPVLCCNHAWG